jgi:hypothetical protein
MKGVTSRISLNMVRINGLERAKIRALEQTAEAIHTDLVQSQTMPFQTGNLQNESTFVNTSNSNRGNVSIVSATPYARRLYFHPEYNFNTEGNPSAGGKWFEPYLPGGKKQDLAKKVFAARYRKEAGL